MAVCQLSITVSATPDSVGIVRHYVEGARRELGCAVESDVLALLTSELVANAVGLGAGEIVVTVGKPDGRLRVEVRDHGYGMPEVLHPMPYDAEGGRGLLIVDELADDWGVQQFLPGKIVWFELDPASPRRASVEAGAPSLAGRETMPM
jgi:anti-sigma regulatory factor (Ser/Thr protein kinase)